MGKINIENLKVVLITGGTQGIGHGIATEFLKSDHFAIICARREPLPTLFSGFEGHWKYYKCDISSTESRNLLLKNIKSGFDRIDVLVNNAGIAPSERRDILKASEQSFEQVMRINLQGPYFLTQIVANWMIEIQNQHSIENYQPSIISISSISAFTSSTFRGEYCVSKAGLSMMTKLYADRLAEYRIPVFEIQPGIIATPMTEGVKQKYDNLIENGLLPIKRWGNPEDIGIASVALAEGKIPYSTGQVLNLDGGFHIRRL
ncbi:MAG: 3-ketoacyl-ACP reductase [Promethearchaeota archaeon]